MNEKEFLWHAERGHGECVQELIKGDINKFSSIVEKLVLNNPAFLSRDEYRMAHTYELASFYNNDEYYISLIFNKLKKRKFDNSFKIDYLIDLLYFFLKKDKNEKYKKALYDILNKHLKRKSFSRENSECLTTLISLLIDLYDEKDLIINIVNAHFKSKPDSNLELSSIEYIYKISFCRKKNISEFDLKFDDCSSLLKKMENDEWFKKNMAWIPFSMDKKISNDLVNYFKDNELDIKMCKKIVRTIFFKNIFNYSLFNTLLKYMDLDKELDGYIYAMFCSIRSQKIKKYGYSLLNTSKFYLGVRIILNNYKEEDYDILHKMIKKVKINYSNSNQWFDIEDILILYFRRKKIDERLLNEVYYFMKNGLSSKTRYDLVKILHKYNYLNEKDKETLKYDANTYIANIFELAENSHEEDS